jgi:hypothetical protein
MRPRFAFCILLVALLTPGGCDRNHSASDGRSSAPASAPALAPDQRSAVESAVRGFMQAVAEDITQNGPAAWQKHFADDPAFFMANDGKLVFPNIQVAAQGIQAFAQNVPRVELHWGDDLRVDALTPNLAVAAASWKEVHTDRQGHQANLAGFFTGVAELRNGQWQFRDAHWSSSSAPAAKTP